MQILLKGLLMGEKKYADSGPAKSADDGDLEEILQF